MLLSRQQNAGQNHHDIKIADISFENVAKLIKSWNDSNKSKTSHEEIRSKLNSREQVMGSLKKSA
jgi:hypothetical protein